MSGQLVFSGYGTSGRGMRLVVGVFSGYGISGRWMVNNHDHTLGSGSQIVSMTTAKGVILHEPSSGQETTLISADELVSASSVAWCIPC